MDASIFALPTVLVSTALAVVMSGIAILFQIRKDRTPDATRYENIKERADQAARELDAKKAELSIVEQKIQQRDRLIAEVASLEERLSLLRAELASLDAARQEIEEVKSQAASAAAELATVQQELQARKAELEEVRRHLDPARLDELRRELKDLEQAKATLAQEVERLRAERDAALRVVEEARMTQATVAALAVERDKLEGERRAMVQAKSELEPEVERLRSERDAARRIVEEAKELQARIAFLQAERTQLEDRVKELEKARSELREMEVRRTTLQDKLSDLDADLRSKSAQLEVVKKTLGETGTGGSEPLDRSKLLEDLIRFPDVLKSPAQLRGVPRDESAALHDVQTYLKQHELEYHERTVHAFHTALKINDVAQLTVLAGVSGTGKSLLPRRYAEAMGIHFLQIAVEPRWDSPQDLLGFYNYIEKKYRATDLARLLVHMDPYDTAGRAKDEEDRTDHMALVLLDEMNLARVEYYFSEFLSRLEVRPRYIEANQKERRKDALIPIDIRGLNETVSLFPSHNVLFVGTMNDDESTQALSDKVMDRANIMQFAAPKEFKKPAPAKSVARPDVAQSFKSWRTWIRSADRLDGASQDRINGAISKLADIMEGCGRPFGHRLRDSILAYVASYPQRGNGSPDVASPLVDQIEFRILPKLRGVDHTSHRGQFEQLQTLLRDDLGDGVFADRLEDICDRQSQIGQFSWRGLARGA